MTTRPLARRLIAALLVLLAAGPAMAQAPADVAGRWEGTLAAGGNNLPLVLHLVEIDGLLTASLDSPAQGAAGIAGEPVLADGRLTVRVPAIGGTYEADVRGDTLDGAWRQGGASFPLVFHRAGAAAPDPHGIAGAWGGMLDAGGTPLRVVVNLMPTADGYAASVDSPDQGAYGIPAQAHVVGDSLFVEVPAVGGTMRGRVAADRSSIAVTLSQGTTTFAPFTLTPTTALAAPTRPQTPQGPFPYTEEEVAFTSAPGVTLAGTITRPPGAGPFPAVALISGSGPQDRDESLMGHRPFAVLADHLTRRGILVLRYDDRGVAGSTGVFDAATSADFAVDAAAAVAHLAARADVGAVGLVGHSEGGVVAPMVAGASERVDFVVLLAGLGVRGDRLLAHQNGLIYRAEGMSAEGAADYETRMAAALARIVALPLDAPVPDDVRAAVRADFAAAAGAMSPADRALCTEGGLAAFGGVLDRLLAELTTPWMRYFLAADPQPALRALRVPALAVFGGHDLQVPPDQNEGPMRAALAASGVAGSEVVVLPRLNHLFQTSETGSIVEYGRIEETMSPVLLDTVSDWILARTAGE